MDLNAYNERIRKLVDARLEEVLDVGDQPTLKKAMMHTPLSGGKRLRPTLVMLVADAISASGEKALPLALALEVVHNFTLVHDDIMDRDDLRRGIPTVHKKWDEATAINTGDALFARAFEILATLNVGPEVFRSLVRAVSKMVRKIGEGQQWDMEFEARKDVTEDEYLKMIERKTALMFMTGAKGGAQIAGGSKEQVTAMWEYGRHIGTGFQIRDDWLNLAADPTKFRKPIGGDLRAGKKTIIILHAMARGDGEAMAPVRHVLGNQEATEEEMGAAIDALRDMGSLEYAQERAEMHARKAREMLETIPDEGNEYRDCLDQLIGFMVEREM